LITFATTLKKSWFSLIVNNMQKRLENIVVLMSDFVYILNQHILVYSGPLKSHLFYRQKAAYILL
jgi:hypothetical protein